MVMVMHWARLRVFVSQLATVIRGAASLGQIDMESDSLFTA
jgi:hypothetical protein